ncbi:MAG: chorismate synthase [Methanomassiliicoccales archaeon]|nr:chorismate synthase [Methanomassiliicoccales archaeon]
MNSIGVSLRFTLFGTSHGPGVGCVLDGVPSGLKVSQGQIQALVDLRKPAKGIGTARTEEDTVQIQSGIVDGVTSGGPVQLFIPNKDTDSSKYEKFKTVPRPGHADYPAMVKYGEAHDIRGGGQFSGRMTAPIVAAGAVAIAMLEMKGIRVAAYSQSIGAVADTEEHDFETTRQVPWKFSTRAAGPKAAALMEKEILKAKADGDSVGGVVRCLAVGLPVGIGEPFFDTLDGDLAKMMLSIPGVKGVEFGAGFRSSTMRGSQNNDQFEIKEGRVVTVTNNAGGILGGLSNGMPLDLRVAFKPTASISKEQRSVDLAKKENTTLVIEGRHDPCIVPRAVVVVEAAAALVLADLCLRGGFIAR